jgi:hypothetical protein
VRGATRIQDIKNVFYSCKGLSLSAGDFLDTMARRTKCVEVQTQFAEFLLAVAQLASARLSCGMICLCKLRGCELSTVLDTKYCIAAELGELLI